MARLTNVRHERFVRHYIKTGVAARAYKLAGYENETRNGLDASASRLLRHGKVKSRIDELRRQMTYRTKVSVESLSNELDEARALAKESGQPSAMVAATVNKAKLFGLMVERRETGQPGTFGLEREEILAGIGKTHGADVVALLRAMLDKGQEHQSNDIPEPESGTLN